jgi:PPOX class probable F420-dependent enzyme
MASIQEPEVRKLLSEPNHAVVSTLNADGSVLSTVVWIDLQNGELAVNSAIGRRWPTNLERDPRITAVVYESENPYNYVEVEGRAEGSTDDADDHIDRLAKKYLGVERYPARRPGERRIKYVITPERVRHQKQG